MEHEFIAENKKYISSRKAAKMTSYAQDYIGQLCRTAKVTARRVGKSWFVEEKSLLEYIEQQKIDKKKNTEKLQRSQKTQQPNNAKDSKESDISTKDEFIEEENDVFVSNRVLIPFVAILLLIAIIGFGVLLNSDVVKRSNLASALSPYNSLQGEINPQVNTIDQTNNDILIEDSIYIASQLHGGLGLLFGGLETLQMMTENLPEGSRLAFVPIDEFGDIQGEYAQSSVDKTQEGLVVIPSGGEEPDEKMVNYIRSSFSDEVIVTPSKDGGSGIIQPVFKDSVGRDYLYVIVPIRK